MRAVRYLGRRVLHLLPVWVGISMLAFVLADLAPGDPAQMILIRRTGQVPTEQATRALRHEIGLDAPVAVRYGRWLASVARGDLGESYSSGGPVARELSDRFPATLELTFAALLFGLVLSIPLGIVAAATRDSPLDLSARFLAIAEASVPSFWSSYLLMLLFAVVLGVLPVAGRGGLRHLVLPALTLGLADAAALTRMTRSALLDELSEDYVRTAIAKGLSRSRAVVRHALRNALNPILTLSGLRVGGLLGQAAIVETVFAWPGIGRYLVESIYQRDYPVIQGFVLYMGTVFVLLNILVDFAYVWLDPRARVTGTREVSRA